MFFDVLAPLLGPVGGLFPPYTRWREMSAKGANGAKEKLTGKTAQQPGKPTPGRRKQCVQHTVVERPPNEQFLKRPQEVFSEVPVKVCPLILRSFPSHKCGKQLVDTPL